MDYPLIYPEEAAEAEEKTVRSKKVSKWEWLHLGLDIAGFIPTLGLVPDLINAVIYAVEGDSTNAALSAAAAIPFVGDVVGGSKLGLKAGRLLSKGTRNSKVIQKVVKYTSNASEFAIKAGKAGLDTANRAFQSVKVTAKAIITEGKIAKSGNNLRKIVKNSKVGKAASKVWGKVAKKGGKSVSGTKQIIKNRYPNELQSGKIFGYSIDNGKIHIENGVQNVDFVINMDGNLHLGRGHSYLANGMDVQAAGTLKVNSQGYVRAISNGSGYYTPTVEQGKMFPSLLNDLGIRTKNAWLELGDYSFTPSGYVDLSKSNTIVEQLR